MCAFGLGPADEEGYYHHRTRVVFRKCEALAVALSRRCPGVGAAHRHVPLRGNSKGSSFSRCQEAGRYCPEFVRTVVSTLQQVLVPGGDDDKTSPTGCAPQLEGEETRAGSHWCENVSGHGLGGYAGWLDELDDDGYIFSGRSDLPTCGVLGPGTGDDTRAGSAMYQAPSEQAKEQAQQYIELAQKVGPGTPMAWAELCKKGGDLVKQAGSVQLAAKSLWEVREDSGPQPFAASGGTLSRHGLAPGPP